MFEALLAQFDLTGALALVAFLGFIAERIFGRRDANAAAALTALRTDREVALSRVGELERDLQRARLDLGRWRDHAYIVRRIATDHGAEIPALPE